MSMQEYDRRIGTLVGLLVSGVGTDADIAELRMLSGLRANRMKPVRRRI